MQSVNPSPENSQLEFLRLMYGDAKTVWVNLIKKLGPDKFTIIQSCHPSQISMVLPKVMEQAETFDTYFQICPQGEKAEGKSRGDADGAAAMPGLWIDLDFGRDGHKAKNNPPTQEAAMKIIEAFHLKPTIIIHTGGGFQAHWLFSELRIIKNKKDRRRAKDLISAFQAFIRAEAWKMGLAEDGENGGWSVDNTADLARIFRLPGTFNYKLANQPRPVQITFWDEGNRYNFEDLEDLGEIRFHLPDGEYPPGPGGKEYPPSDLHLIVEKCPAMAAWADEEKGKDGLPEPFWKCGIDVFVHCIDGPDFIHKISQLDPRYQEKQTRDKINAALKFGKPRTCRSIRHNGGEPYCSTCPHLGKIKSPISLGRVAPAPDFTAIEVINGCLCRVKYDSKGNKKPTTVAYFYILPIEAYLVQDEGEYLKALFIAGDRKVEVLLPPDTWRGQANFLKRIPSIDFTFIGNGVDVQQILHHLTTSYDIPRKIGVKVAGFYNGNEYFVTEDGALSRSGPTSEIVYVGDKCNCGLLNGSITPFDYSIIKNFNTPQVVMPILGFAAACFFKPILLKILGGFPILLVEGEPGAGKTYTIEEILMRIWAQADPPRLIAEQTRFTFMKLVGSSNAIPCVFDENKASRQWDKQKNLISALVRSTFNALEGHRGRADLSMQTYRYQAPVVISGETGFVEPALNDRLLTVQMSKMLSQPHKAGFEAVKKMPLETIGRLLLQKALTMGGEEIEIILAEERKAVSPALSDRPGNNAAVGRFGIRMLNQVLGTDFDPTPIDQAIIENVLEDGAERKSNVDNILEAMYLMSTYEIKDNEEGGSIKRYTYQDKLEEGIHYQDDNSYIRLWVAGAYSIFSKWSRIHGFDSDIIPERTFTKQLKTECYFVEYKNARIGSSVRKCFILDLAKMKKKGIIIGEEWEVSW